MYYNKLYFIENALVSNHGIIAWPCELQIEQELEIRNKKLNLGGVLTGRQIREMNFRHYSKYQ